MFIRKILIPLSGRFDPQDSESLDVPALEVGLGVARRFEAHAEVLCVTAEPSAPDERWSAWVPGYGAHELIRWVHKESEARRRHARSCYEQVLSTFDPQPVSAVEPSAGFSVNFVEEVGEIRATVGEYGRVADLIVIAGSTARWEAPFRPILEASLRRTACPVLVSPATTCPTFGTKIAIAWNDSVESARAVTAAMGLMKLAEQVLVICCTEGDREPPETHRLVDYLAWHDIEAESVELAEHPRQVPQAIVGAAVSADCDLLLLGAYIHNRAASLLFGSLTEYALSNPRLPTLVVP